MKDRTSKGAAPGADLRSSLYQALILAGRPAKSLAGFDASGTTPRIPPGQIDTHPNEFV